MLLKGGSEALRTNRALVGLIHGVLETHDVDPAAVGLLEDRAAFQALLDLDELVDIIIARGSSEFVQLVMDKTRIPVMGHAEGLCHIYLHGEQDPARAARIVVDAKCDYPAACNAVETLLWDKAASDALDAAIEGLKAEAVELRGCEATRQRHPDIAAARDDGLGCRVHRKDSQHPSRPRSRRRARPHRQARQQNTPRPSSPTIRTPPNASSPPSTPPRPSTTPRHASPTANRFGLGAEVGISTGKLHARGPVGVEGLLSYRWLLRGAGQIAADYGPGKKKFRHEDL